MSELIAELILRKHNEEGTDNCVDEEEIVEYPGVKRINDGWLIFVCKSRIAVSIDAGDNDKEDDIITDYWY